MSEQRLIDVDEAVKRIAGIARIARSDPQKALLGRCIYIIEHCPAVDAEPVRHGRWVEGIACSECRQVDLSKPNYCPNCGAKMDGGKDND